MSARPGHVHQAVVNDNHDVDNTGPILYTDILFPFVAIVLYAARERLRGRATAGAREYEGEAAAARPAA